MVNQSVGELHNDMIRQAMAMAMHTSISKPSTLTTWEEIKTFL